MAAQSALRERGNQQKALGRHEGGVIPRKRSNISWETWGQAPAPGETAYAGSKRNGASTVGRKIGKREKVGIDGKKKEGARHEHDVLRMIAISQIERDSLQGIYILLQKDKTDPQQKKREIRRSECNIKGEENRAPKERRREIPRKSPLAFRRRCRPYAEK